MDDFMHDHAGFINQRQRYREVAIVVDVERVMGNESDSHVVFGRLISLMSTEGVQ